MHISDVDEATTLTVKELRDAVVRVVPQEFDEIDDTMALLLANDIIRMVLNFRERDWRAGDVVRDSNGIVWQRLNNVQWRKMATPGVFSHGRPHRPLTLMWSPKDEADMDKHLAGLERARDDGAPI